MQLRVRATGRCGIVSDRAANHNSVYGITSPGLYWAVDAKVERSNHHQLREGAIVRYWRTKEQAEADSALIRRGRLYYKQTDRRYFDPIVTAAEAYWG